MPGPQSLGPAHEYLLDAWQRSILFLDILRQRGNIYRDQQAKTAPNVLQFEAELVLEIEDVRGDAFRVLAEQCALASGDLYFVEIVPRFVAIVQTDVNRIRLAPRHCIDSSAHALYIS